MIVRRALKNSTVVAGGGAIDVWAYQRWLYHDHLCLSAFWALEINVTFFMADGNKSLLEAACSHNSWEVSAIYQLLCKSTGGN